VYVVVDCKLGTEIKEEGKKKREKETKERTLNYVWCMT
jgi:hypothetical protein